MSRTVAIVEAPDYGGWDLTWSDGGVEHQDTAAAALASVRARDAALVAGGAAVVVTRIEWQTRSNVGTTVVRALSGRTR